MYLNYKDKGVKVKYFSNQNNGAISETFFLIATLPTHNMTCVSGDNFTQKYTLKKQSYSIHIKAKLKLLQLCSRLLL